jgi:hypothetical protein
MEVISTERFWIFVLSLVAVINGLGIVRLLTVLSDSLKRRAELNVQYYWVHTLYLIFQLLMHLLIWWSIVGLHKIGDLNFLSYLYVLVGPTFLFLATTLLIPDAKTEAVDLRAEYYGVRKAYFSLMSGFYLWAIFVWPVFGHDFAPTVPLIIAFLMIALVSIVTDKPRLHAAMIIANLTVYMVFIILYATHLSELGHSIAVH